MVFTALKEALSGSLAHDKQSVFNQMKLNIFLAFLLGLNAPSIGAWNLVSKVNADARGLPGAETLVSVASGTASAYPTAGNPYPGNVICLNATTCQFGPISASRLYNSQRTMTVMGCTSYYNCGGQITDTNVTVNTGMTWEEAIKAWVDKHGTSVTRTHAYAYSTATGWTTQICAAWGTYGAAYFMMPGTDSCATPPIPPNQCDVLGASVDLNHGVLKVGEITGSTAKATRQVTCTQSANVRYLVSEGNPVAVGLGVSTTLTVNGVKAGDMIKLPAGTSSLTIASTLTDNGAQAGEFSKTVVLIQSFM